MKNSFFLLFLYAFILSCGESFLQLASEVGDYSTQQFRDTEQIRKMADSCNYEKTCFTAGLDPFIREFCKDEEYNKRGFISENECKRQYPYVFLQLFESGKYASIEGIKARDEYREALNEYEKELEKWEDVKEDWRQAQSDWEEAQEYENDEEYEDAQRDWEDAKEEYDEAREEYDEAWKIYDKAKKKYKGFLND